ncbi:hypothetical protein JYU34_006795 [Plutella xylostella]|uniref:Uncharacterized protein n=3 Tax=Plutella xylostella TaxID=51655 RepID=A0ABQ7QSV3_PLUXY|nr:hypothetical protein JYU34_015669 [Plutella xylostella]KAG7301766.1 hypothetical protein JYU34_014778 [Plutella xylostella]KAG7302840.1 hypothetical protein JYU34_012820 [Plutella xylostella]KAG7308133.1 hypothetical protein JYU34_006795 [Plutella xylostella]
MEGYSNASSLRQLISQVKQNIAALKNLGEAVDQWDNVMVCLLIRKIDSESSKAYYLQHNNNAKPTLSEFLTFLEQRAFALESMEGKRETQSVSMPRKLQVSNVVVKEAKCLYCGASAAA